MFTISVSLVIMSIYPCTPVYGNVKCRTRDNTSPYSSFWREICIWPRAFRKWRQQTSQRNRNIFFFYRCGSVLLSTTLALTPSCWHIGHMFFDNFLIISSGRAVFVSLSLLIAVEAMRLSKYKRHPKPGRNRWCSALFHDRLPHC